MIKRFILAIAVIFPMSIFAQKFGVVDLESVFQAMPETETMKAQLTESSKKYEAEFQKLREELDRLYAQFQTISQDKNTPESIKELRMQEIQERQQNVEKFQNTAHQDLTRLQEQLMAPIQQKLAEAVKTVGQEGDFTFIFPNEQQLLLYQGATVINVTDTVKAKLGLK